jgi:hypothetical protein
MHSAGGTGPYLSLKARLPGLRRQEVDDVVFRRLELFEVPCVRSSTMLVPRADLAVALAAGRRAFVEWEKKLAKLGVARKELETLAARVVTALGGGTLSADQLRRDVPSKLIRDLGDAGKQLGFATTLPVALRLLQLDGRVIRLAQERRLDGKLHFYRAAESDAGPPPADLDRALAERFVTWSGSTHVDDFAWWAGIGKRVAKAALEGLEAGTPTAALATDGVALLPFRDNHFALRHGTTPEPHHNTIVAGGALAGLWEYDREGECVVWRCEGKPPRGLEAAIAATEEFIREELGDHRFYAVDHPAARAKRIAELRT